MKRILTIGIVLLGMAINVAAQTTFCIAKDGKAATIVVDEQDWKGVIRAANDLGDDIRKVAPLTAPEGASIVLRSNGESIVPPSGGERGAIIVGTIGKSRCCSGVGIGLFI